MTTSTFDPDTFTPVITDAAIQFLRIQQGRISKLIDGPKAWRAAYKRQLVDTLAAIDHWIPRPLNSVLDIGGGMGGFDALLNSLQPGLQITILDGFNNPAEVQQRDQPYSNARVAEAFLRENGVRDLWFFRPDRLPASPPKFDLVISLQAWCFHFPPAAYLNFALQASHPGTIWILDVRTPQDDWLAQLSATDRLQLIGVADGFTEKYRRMAFSVLK
jgi:hypothetical protein